MRGYPLQRRGAFRRSDSQLAGRCGASLLRFLSKEDEIHVIRSRYFSGVAGVLLLSTLATSGCGALRPESAKQVKLAKGAIPLIHADGLLFRDLDRSGALEPYEDWRRPAAERAADLVARMTLEEKAGAMMHANPPARAAAGVPGAGSEWDMAAVGRLVLDRHVTFLLNRLKTDPASLANQQNALQAIAEQGRLGIPVTISSDPRSQFSYAQGVSVDAGAFTKWPDPAGMAATGDPELVRRFADSVRQEYLAVGIRMALSPQADLAVNPRWHRSSGTFGSDPAASARFVRAYVAGMQDGESGIHRNSVVSVVKHWVGYGATMDDGADAHNYYGRRLDIDGVKIERHILPFTGAFAARVGAVMPSYGMPATPFRVLGSTEPVEPVGMGFNRVMLTDVLRGRMGFDGVVLSDWQVTDDCSRVCRSGANPGEKPQFSDIAMPWGVEALDKAGRYLKAIDAGVDQFGGSSDPEIVVSLVRSGRLDVSRVDAAVTRIMKQKFEQGLFEDPYVDAGRAASIVGNDAFRRMALDAQHRSLVLLKNGRHLLPVSPTMTKVFVYGFDADAMRRRGFTIVQRPEEADFAVVEMATPFEVLHPNFFFGARYREGSTRFREDAPALAALAKASAVVPTIASIYMERPIDLSGIANRATAIIANFGATPDAIVDALTGESGPVARLPYDLVWTDRLREQTTEPVSYRMGEGLGY
ncbi:glycoside hydrolase family 3 N-terminal domain-containing protein [Burkholderia contaminans]|uniref:beta-glucosidase n=1 Tax=Burkholderia contaminans TaxID=488447 RepID=A0A3N8RNJ0_9BURK|nr:glycoside hydrolase family 3 N-terminal domain-containing protein [Burkholderia contaminans]RQT37465.1 glycoside hydrolase family 3 protein [Burkholderia contaminans]